MTPMPSRMAKRSWALPAASMVLLSRRFSAVEAFLSEVVSAAAFRRQLRNRFDAYASQGFRALLEACSSSPLYVIAAFFGRARFGGLAYRDTLVFQALTARGAYAVCVGPAYSARCPRTALHTAFRKIHRLLSRTL